MRERGFVVVTGASSGIGRAAALRLARGGFRVLGTVRRESDARDLVEAGGGPVAAIALEVRDRASIERAASEVVGIVGDRGLAGLVNNAGIVVAGPLEHLPLADFERQIEVNLTGVLAVTQAFLPLLRRARGRVVNVSSISGALAFPLMGAYNASKFALEALSDALRMELSPWGLAVSLVCPGPVKTPIWERATADAERIGQALPEIARTRYGPLIEASRASARQSEERGCDPDRIARAIEHALTARRPRTRYRFGLAHLLRALPDRWRDALILRHLDHRPPPPPG